MSVGLLRLSFYLPDCRSLKDKRSMIKPILARLHQEFNISVIESDDHDLWQSCRFLIACAARDGAQAEILLEKVVRFFEGHWPDLPLTDEQIEIMNG